MSLTVRQYSGQRLRPDPDRVISRLFLPSVEPPHLHRAQQLVERVLAIDDDTVAELLPPLLAEFGLRHRDLNHVLRGNAAMVHPPEGLSDERLLLLGAVFTSEYAVEGAALCNPSVVRHPDQSGLADGELRVAVSLRGIGEGHFSVLQFTSAVVDAEEWRFEARDGNLLGGNVASASVSKKLVAELVRNGGEYDELTSVILRMMPRQVTGQNLEQILVDLPPDLLLHPEAHRRVDMLRRAVGSAYTVTFPEDSRLDQRVLLPAAEDESNGVEDARFTLFHDGDFAEYRACYTAYNGHAIGNRLLTSPDLRTFTSCRLSGPGARNKGMALFPRPIGGRQLALSRADGVTIGVTSSSDGLRWREPVPIERPSAPWQIIQTGNAGPPLETPRGWLVVVHGVGPMRTYSLGAVLLDLEDPTRIIGRLRRPLLAPYEHAGYVPNVVFSCGTLTHAGRLFIPYGMGDATVGVASVLMDELLDELSG